MRIASLTFTAVLLVSLVGGAASADPAKPAPTKLAAADQKVYDAQLAQGRKLEAAGKHADAITAFQAGLAVAPDDATLLGELGASAMNMKDYTRAEQWTRKSIASSASPDVLGASLFNLGYIQEAEHKQAAAIASYTASLRARPNTIVRTRLTKLDPTAASLLDPYKPVALAGPFASVDAFCKSLPAKVDIYGDGDMYDCGCGEYKNADSVKAPVLALGAPYQGAVMIARSCPVPHTENELDEYSLAVQLPTGWYVAAAVDKELANRHCNQGFAFTGAKVSDVAAAPGAELLASFEVQGDCVGGDTQEDWTQDSTVVVGIGNSKVPSATPRMTRTKHTTTQDIYGRHQRVTGDVALDFAWGKDGTFNVTGRTKGIDSTEAQTLVGKHELVFP